MDIDEAIEGSVNVKRYWDDKIIIELIEEILDSGRYAVHAGNSINWKVIVVTDEDVRSKIATCCMKQDWISKSPVVLVICSDPTTLKKLYGKKGEEVFGTHSALAAAENMRVTATSFGISSCWVNFFDEKSLRRALKIPDKIKPEVVLTLGYSDVKEREKDDLATLDKIVYFNRWGNFRLPEKEWEIDSSMSSIKQDIKRGVKKLKNLFRSSKK